MNNDTLKVELEAGNTNHFLTNMLFRDTSAWYHVVVTFDSTNGTQANRVKIYVNGVDQSGTGGGGFSTANYPSQNATSGFNTTSQHEISTYDGSDYHLDGYLAEVNFIDGTALTAASFGETKDGIWVPKDASGLTFGTNGFYLPFDDSSAIGDDESSNTNDWTVANLVASDVVLDSPTNNFCTINSTRESVVNSGSASFTEGNLKSVDAGTTHGNHWTSTFGMTSGKWYWEVLAITMGGNYGNIGITNDLHRAAVAGTGVFYGNDGKRNPAAFNSGTTSYGATYTDGDIIGIAFDADNESVNFYKNNTAQGAVGSVLTASNGPYFASVGDAQNTTTYAYHANFGQDSSFAGAKTAQGNADSNGVGDFFYSPPSGFLALASSNLPEPDIIDGTENFNTVLYTGNASTNAITGVGFSPDWVWIKNRGRAGQGHVLHDTVRGNDGAEALLLQSDTTAAETHYDNFGVTTFDSGGFTVVGNGGLTNLSSDTYVAWHSV